MSRSRRVFFASLSFCVSGCGLVLLVLNGPALLAWVLVFFGLGLAGAYLVAAGTQGALKPRRVSLLVLLAPVFALAYGAGRMLRGKTFSWTHALELGLLSAMVVLGLAAGLRMFTRSQPG